MRKATADNRGASIVEVIVALGVLAIGGTALTMLAMSGLQSTHAGGERTRAAALARESLDAASGIAAGSWNALFPGTYGLDGTGGSWALAESPDASGIFTRAIVIEETERDAGGGVAAGVPDIHTRKVTATVSWTSSGREYAVSSARYVTNWDSESAEDDTAADFDAGTHDSTMTASADNGEVTLLSNTLTDLTAYDAPGSLDGNAVAISGNTVYLVRQGGNGDEIAAVDMADPENSVELGVFDLGSNADAYAVAAVGAYVYVATALNGSELVVMDVSNPAAMEIETTYDTPGNSDGRSLAVFGDRLYLGLNRSGGSEHEFFIFDISSPGSPAFISSLDVPGNVRGIAITGNHAVLATGDQAGEVVTMNLSNESSPTIAGTLDLSGNEGATAVMVAGNFAYVTRESGSTGKFHIIDISSPADPVARSEILLVGGGNAVWSDGVRAFVGTDVTAAEFSSFNVTNPDNPVPVEAVDVGDWVNGIAYHEGLRVFALATIGNARELVFANPGPGAYVSAGSYESAVIDAGSSAKWFTAEWTEDLTCPASTLSVWIRTAAELGGLAAEPWQAVTPSAGALLSTDHDGDRYLQYRADLSSDGSCTPRLLDIRFTYKPS